MLKKYAYAWITLAFFTVSIALHWGFGWLAYVDDQTSHGQAVRLSPYLVEIGRRPSRTGSQSFCNFSGRSSAWPIFSMSGPLRPKRTMSEWRPSSMR